MIINNSKKTTYFSKEKFLKLTVLQKELSELGIIADVDDTKAKRDVSLIISEKSKQQYLEELSKTQGEDRIYFACLATMNDEGESFRIDTKCYYADGVEDLYMYYYYVSDDETDIVRHIEKSAQHWLDTYLKTEHNFCIELNTTIQKNMVVKLKVNKTINEKPEYYFVDTNKDTIIINEIMGLKKGDTKTIKTANNVFEVTISNVYEVSKMQVTDKNFRKLNIDDVDTFNDLKAIIKRLLIREEIEKNLEAYKGIVYALMLKVFPFLNVHETIEKEVIENNNVPEVFVGYVAKNIQEMLIDKLFYKEFKIDTSNEYEKDEKEESLNTLFLYDEFKFLKNFRVKRSKVKKHIGMNFLRRYHLDEYKKLLRLAKQYEINL